MNTRTLPATIVLHRPWTQRAWDAVRDAWTAWRDERIARQAIESALELPEATLRDIGAPQWLQEEARLRSELRRRDLDAQRVRDRLGVRGYY